MDAQDLNRDGVYLLAAVIIEDCISVGSVERALKLDKTTPLDVALTWAVWCGQEPHDAARGIVCRARSCTEQRRERDGEAHRRYAQQMSYSHGRRCPHCGVPITNGARTCPKHKWYK